MESFKWIVKQVVIQKVLGFQTETETLKVDLMGQLMTICLGDGMPLTSKQFISDL